MAKEMIKKESEELVANQMAIDFSADAGAGMEGIDKDSFSIPFIKLLQSNSPEVDELETAKAGMFCNSISMELFKEILVIPCAYQRRFIRWAPRHTGEGFKGEYMPTDIETNNVSDCRNINGRWFFDVPKDASPLDDKGKALYDEARDTRSHFVLYLSGDGNWYPAVMSLSSTMIKKSKRWMSRIQMVQMKDAKGRSFNPPSFSHVYKVNSVDEEKNGNKWKNIEVSLYGMVEEADIYARAREFNHQIAAGEIKVQPMQDDGHGNDAGDSEDGRF